MNWFNKIFNRPKETKKIEAEPITEKDDVNIPRGRQYITGHDVTYVVPDDMRLLKVQIQEPNGRILNEYTLTQYLEIRGGNKLRIMSR